MPEVYKKDTEVFLHLLIILIFFPNLIVLCPCSDLPPSI